MVALVTSLIYYLLYLPPPPSLIKISSSISLNTSSVKIISVSNQDPFAELKNCFLCYCINSLLFPVIPGNKPIVNDNPESDEFGHAQDGMAGDPESTWKLPKTGP
jgi:hypothetical protein